MKKEGEIAGQVPFSERGGNPPEEESGLKLKLKDGSEITLSAAEMMNADFRLGMQARSEGWGGEGRVLQKNGPAFRMGWYAKAYVDQDIDFPFTEAEIRDALK